jgi:hypothetical protein
MHKLATIGALVAALAVPASATGKAPVRPSRVACPQSVVIPPPRGYGMCGGRFWIRISETGKVKAIPFWRLQRLNDPNEDRP